MTESYCGLTCKTCSHRENGTCPGCKAGPGRAITGDCEIARCSRGRSLTGCNVCGNRSSCTKWRTREGMVAHRQRMAEAEKIQQSILSRELPELARWLRILFILRICAIFFPAADLTGLAPSLQVPIALIDLIIQLACGGILIKLGNVSNRYRIAGLCYIVVEILDFIPNFMENATWMLVLGLVLVIPSLIGEYQEILAHAEQAERINEELAEKWRKLWIWYLVDVIVLLFSEILTIMASAFGAFIMLVSTVGLLVVAILRLFYLYRTVKEFREYAIEI